MSTGLPYDGYYNGHVDMQMANGTYADFRYMLVKKVELKKMEQPALDAFDKEWEAIPLEERQRRRSIVVEDTTPKETVLQSNEGPVVVFRSKPSEGNNIKKDREKTKVKKQRRLPAGALTAENSPLK